MNAAPLFSGAVLGVAMLAGVPGAACAGADPFEQGCVSCHVVDPASGMDHRLSIRMKEWTAGRVAPGLLERSKAAAPSGVTLKGRHPEVDDSFEDIPAACLDCHGTDSRKAPPFTRLVHLVHLVGGEQNVFVKAFNGDCTHCHKLDEQTGQWRLPSGPEQ